MIKLCEKRLSKIELDLHQSLYQSKLDQRKEVTKQDLINAITPENGAEWKIELINCIKTNIKTKTISVHGSLLDLLERILKELPSNVLSKFTLYSYKQAYIVNSYQSSQSSHALSTTNQCGSTMTNLPNVSRKQSTFKGLCIPAGFVSSQELNLLQELSLDLENGQAKVKEIKAMLEKDRRKEDVQAAIQASLEDKLKLNQGQFNNALFKRFHL